MAEARRASSSPSQVEDPKDSSCSICLETVEDEAFLDRCFHRFCHRCIARWTKIVAGQQPQPLQSIRCPLCKRENFSILHDLGGSGFRQQYVNQDLESSFYSRAHIFRWQCYCSNPGPLNCKLNVPLYWKRRRYLKRNFWLEIWLRREMQALTQEKDVDIIVHHVHGVIEFFMERLAQEHSSPSTEDKRGEFRALVADAARAFIPGQVERFVDELEFFLVSGLNIEAYDEMYRQCLDVMSSGSTSSCDREGDGGAGILNFFSEDSEYTG